MDKILKNKGITIISLILAIISLLIIAGVSFAMLTGENGILNKTNLAKEKTNIAQEQEKLVLTDYENKIDTVDGSREKFQKTILWSGNINQVNIDATLNDSIENYEFILLQTSWGDVPFYDTVLDVDTIKSIGYESNKIHALICMYHDFYMYVKFKSNNSLVITENIGEQTHLKKVIGIK